MSEPLLRRAEVLTVTLPRAGAASLLFRYAVRKGMGEAFGQKEPSPAGKTVGDLIAAERARQEMEKKASSRCARQTRRWTGG